MLNFQHLAEFKSVYITESRGNTTHIKAKRSCTMSDEKMKNQNQNRNQNQNENRNQNQNQNQNRNQNRSQNQSNR